MVYSYGVRKIGYYHIKENTVCQDYFGIAKIDKDSCFAVVADGLGSELYSDVASRLAVESCIKYCKEHINPLDLSENIIQIIRDSFQYALNSIKEEAENKSQALNQYDTTLSFVFFINDKVYYGHSGDSGIVALLKSGLYIAVTKQQRDENGCVFPLGFTDHWVFGEIKDVVSVFLATDGMLETLFPNLLFNEPVNIYVALARYFMDNACLQFGVVPEEQVQLKMEKFIESIPESQVNDDKTVVCLVNDEIKSELQSEEYYKVPDWNALRKKKEEEFRRLAYPELFGSRNN